MFVGVETLQFSSDVLPLGGACRFRALLINVLLLCEFIVVAEVPEEVVRAGQPIMEQDHDLRKLVSLLLELTDRNISEVTCSFT